LGISNLVNGKLIFKIEENYLNCFLTSYIDPLIQS
jgi:hypothetical protein